MVRFEVRRICSALNYFVVWDCIKHEWIDVGSHAAMDALCKMLNR